MQQKTDPSQPDSPADQPFNRTTKTLLGWRWLAVALIFVFGLTAFASGVALTERPDVTTAPLLERIYYILGLFVVGGLDLGMPTGVRFGHKVFFGLRFSVPRCSPLLQWSRRYFAYSTPNSGCCVT